MLPPAPLPRLLRERAQRDSRAEHKEKGREALLGTGAYGMFTEENESAGLQDSFDRKNTSGYVSAMAATYKESVSAC